MDALEDVVRDICGHDWYDWAVKNSQPYYSYTRQPPALTVNEVLPITINDLSTKIPTMVLDFND